MIKLKLHQEQTKREWGTIKKASGALRTKSITVVEMVEQGREVRTKGKEDTERAILDCLVERCGGLTSNTPMTAGGLAVDLGHLCENEELRMALLSSCRTQAQGDRLLGVAVGFHQLLERD